MVCQSFGMEFASNQFRAGRPVRKREIYLAFGVSGANFHTIGMYRSGWILAVNIDEKARIFRLADYCVRADAESIIDKLLEGLPPEPFSSTEEIRSYVIRQVGEYPHFENAVRIND